MSRLFVSLSVLFSFIILFITSLALYVVPGNIGPEGWMFWGLKRNQWTDLHITGGFLFLAFGVYHTFLNLRAFKGIFKKVLTFNIAFIWPLVAALALNVFIVTATINHLQPVEQVLHIYKDTKQKLRKGYIGNPPKEVRLDSLKDLMVRYY